jgi:hypothetical protein
MALEQKTTMRGKRIRQEFVEAMEANGITEDRIVYTGSTKHFSGECPEIYREFLSRYDIPKEALILHDGGHAFKEKSESILEKLGFAKHAVYPSDVHQWLSPNDNNLHGCKATWRSQCRNFPDDVSTPLQLMRLIDLDTVENSRGYFFRNLIGVKRSGIRNIREG